MVNEIQRSRCSGSLPIIDLNALPPGTWARRWPDTGCGVAHDFIIGNGGWSFENAGPGSHVRAYPTAEIVNGQAIIEILDVPQSWPQSWQRLAAAQAKVGWPWRWTYNCQDYAHEVVTGVPQSFQRDAVHATLLLGTLFWLYVRTSE
jgi:hypothetical protein